MVEIIRADNFKKVFIKMTVNDSSDADDIFILETWCAAHVFALLICKQIFFNITAYIS